jgi:hypothetical protein
MPIACRPPDELAGSAYALVIFESRCNKDARRCAVYSITSSAYASSCNGIKRPSALAVF